MHCNATSPIYIPSIKKERKMVTTPVKNAQRVACTRGWADDPAMWWDNAPYPFVGQILLIRTIGLPVVAPSPISVPEGSLPLDSEYHTCPQPYRAARALSEPHSTQTSWLADMANSTSDAGISPYKIRERVALQELDEILLPGIPNFATPAQTIPNVNAYISQQLFPSGPLSWPLHSYSNIETVGQVLDASFSAPNHVFNGVCRNLIGEDISPRVGTGSLTGCKLVSPQSPMISNDNNSTQS